MNLSRSALYRKFGTSAIRQALNCIRTDTRTQGSGKVGATRTLRILKDEHVWLLAVGVHPIDGRKPSRPRFRHPCDQAMLRSS
jgi:glycerol-3-phosphate acyltransferase PlsY